MTKKLKKVLFVIPSLQIGGMERVMSQLLIYFSRNENLEIHLLLYGIKRNISYNIPSNIIIHKPSFIFNNSKRNISTIKTLLFIRKSIKQINPLRILSFGEYWNNLILLSSIGLPHKIFVSDRAQPDKSLGKLHDFLRKKLYPKATKVICQTETAKKYYEQNIKLKNITVIGNPIKKVEIIKDNVEENIVLSVGRLIETKNFNQLISLFSSINNKDWKLVIVGDNALKQNNKEKLQKLIDELEMQNSIVLAGKRKDVDRYYSKSKIFAFTSSSEGFPNVIGEAMSAGLPVISYDCVAGPSDLIDNNVSGFLIPLFNKDIYQQKLTELMNDQSLRQRMGNEALKKVKCFSLDVIGEKYNKLMFNEDCSN